MTKHGPGKPRRPAPGHGHHLSGGGVTIARPPLPSNKRERNRCVTNC